MWNRIRHWHNRLEPEHALLVAVHHRSLIRTLATWVLHIVEAFAVRLPDIDLHALYGFAGGVLDVAEDEAGLAIGVVGYYGAVGRYLGFVGVEGAENCAFCAVGWFGVVDAVDEEGEAQNV